MRLGTLCGRDVDVWVWAGRCQIILWKNCGKRKMQCGCLCSSVPHEKKGQSSSGGFAESEMHLLQKFTLPERSHAQTNKHKDRYTQTHIHIHTQKKNLYWEILPNIGDALHYNTYQARTTQTSECGTRESYQARNLLHFFLTNNSQYLNNQSANELYM